MSKFIPEIYPLKPSSHLNKPWRFSMDIVALLTALQTQIQALTQALADAQVAADSIHKEAYDKGFADGVASVPPPAEDLTPFSQADVDAAVQAAVAGMTAEMEALKAEVEALKLQVERVMASVEQAKLDAVAAFKAELLVKFEEQMAVENAAETAFAEMLK